MADINNLKERGNAALTAGKFDEAIQAYTEAINLDETNHVLYSNRSAAYLKAGKLQESLNDAEKTIEINSKWPKGYSRKGAVLFALEKYDEAYTCYNKGLEFDPSNIPLKQGQEQVKHALIQQLIGQAPMDVDSPESPKAKPREPSPPPQAKKVPTEDDNLPEHKKLAKKEKDAGNAAYKKKDFNTALDHYKKAIEHDPTDITFYSNIAAVYFEQKDFRKCITECEKAIEIGRENRADYKLIAKAFTRLGNSCKKLGEFKQAKINFEKSLSEHRTPEVKTLLSQVEAIIREEERRAFIDPEKAEEEKEKGNEYFKKGDFSSAVKHYTEAINRNPDDPKLYSNRAACYTKLAAFDLGLKDCEMCIKLDEKFIKGWIRKGKILQGMQNPSQALTAYQKALEIDPTNSEAIDGYRTCTMAVHSNPEEVRKKAMNDPEVQSILKDPAMRMILEQMQSDPKAVQEHLRNPEVANKIQKLMETGIIQIH
ncbi:CLUMA_CG007583, isoform A [Clunio marinus]|uniref:Stress-induced-phosphoprotein 1 n=1 Tax=Clunio marinus TaxID=568069 RepID=A0A1J1I387_9DIPT|nr:CLUMA_CG007583, isoform A [Clunio marinus]